MAKDGKSITTKRRARSAPLVMGGRQAVNRRRASHRKSCNHCRFGVRRLRLSGTLMVALSPTMTFPQIVAPPLMRVLSLMQASPHIEAAPKTKESPETSALPRTLAPPQTTALSPTHPAELCSKLSPFSTRPPRSPFRTPNIGRSALARMRYTTYVTSLMTFSFDSSVNSYVSILLTPPLPIYVYPFRNNVHAPSVL